MTEEKNTLASRMKAYEEEARRHDGELSHNPVVLRLDGVSFHVWTRKVLGSRPFDADMVDMMRETMKSLCDLIPSAVFGYTQSDEITIVLRNDQSPDSEPWHRNRLFKLASVPAAMAAGIFNVIAWRKFHEKFQEPSRLPVAAFDCRVIYLPSVEEVVNNLIWRQNDCMRNSVSAFSETVFERRRLFGVRTSDRLVMLVKAGKPWESLPAHLRLGSCCRRVWRRILVDGNECLRKPFEVFDAPRMAQDKGFVLDSYYNIMKEGV